MTGSRPSLALCSGRTLILAVGLLLFLPPLSALFQLTGDVGFCGRWCPRMFFVWRQGASPGAYFSGWLRCWAGFGLMAAVLATTFVLGRVWCSHLCPVGGLMELGSRALPARVKLDFSVLPAAPIRYAYMLVYVLAPAVGLGSLCCSYCNLAAVPRLLGAVFSEADLMFFLRTQGAINLALIVVLGFLAAGGRAYCNLLCPVGALDALVARVGARTGRRVRIDRLACSGCGACAEICPTWAIDTLGGPRVDQLSCIPCRRCEAACPAGAITCVRPRDPGPTRGEADSSGGRWRLGRRG